MSKNIKAGDRIRWKPGRNGVRTNGALDVTATYVGVDWCVYTWRTSSGNSGEEIMRRDDWDSRIEKVPDFFEAGKTYRIGGPDGDRFEVTRVEYNEDGSPVAFGYLTLALAMPRRAFWTVKRQNNFNSGWKEEE